MDKLTQQKIAICSDKFNGHPQPPPPLKKERKNIFEPDIRAEHLWAPPVSKPTPMPVSEVGLGGVCAFSILIYIN